MRSLKFVAAAALAGSMLATVAGAAERNLNVPKPGSPPPPPIAVGDLGMAIMSAAINGADGSIARGEGVINDGTGRLSAGTYEVAFGRDITQCTYQITVGESGIGGASPAAVGVTRRSGNNAGVFVRIVNPPDEVSEDRDFFVLVYCGR